MKVTYLSGLSGSSDTYGVSGAPRNPALGPTCPEGAWLLRPAGRRVRKPALPWAQPTWCWDRCEDEFKSRIEEMWTHVIYGPSILRVIGGGVGGVLPAPVTLHGHQTAYTSSPSSLGGRLLSPTRLLFLMLFFLPSP